jgi:hypothetical protein
MFHPSNSPVAALLISTALSLCAAAEKTDAPAFFDTLLATYQKEYVECTGDHANLSVKYIIAWKNQLDEWTKSKDYADQRADYKKCVDTSGSISPCKLRDWAERHKIEQDAAEPGIVNAVLEGGDSSEAAQALLNHPAGAFDFPGIPFGVSRNIFSYLFKKKNPYDLIVKDAFLYVENMPWGNGTYLTAFYFGANDMFYKYEIETPGRPADSLNTVVRPEALELASVFEQKFGAPRREYRVGYFDIKSKELSPLKKWDAADYSAIIGLSVLKYRYYVKAIVTDAKLAQEPVAGK